MTTSMTAGRTVRAQKHTKALALSAAFSLALLGAVLAPQPATAAPGATISGVLLEGEDPVANAVVSAYAVDSDAYVFEAEARTNAAGEWQMQTLPDGDYTLEFLTDHSSAIYALGETLAGEESLDDEPAQFTISEGVASDTPFESVTLTRLGGAISLELLDEDGDLLIDLDDAAAQIRGLAADGTQWNSRTFWADEEGSLLVPRVPVGGFVPWVASGGGEFAPVTEGVVIEQGEIAQAGSFLVPTPVESEFDVSGELAITGKGAVGETASVQWPELSPEPASTQVTWVRDTAVLAANEPAYEITADDLGTTLTAWGFAFAPDHAPMIGYDSVVIQPEDDGGATEDDESTGDADSGGSTADTSGAADDGSDGSGEGSDADSDAGSDAGSASAADDATSGSDAGEPLPDTGGSLHSGLIVASALLLLTGATAMVARRRRSMA